MPETSARNRRWADIVVVIVAVYALAAAMWAPPELYSRGHGYEVTNTQWLIGAYSAGGILGIAGVLVPLRWSAVAGRVLAGAGALIYLSGLFALDEIGLIPVLSILVPGLAMLAAAPFVGAMPTPESEGKHR